MLHSLGFEVKETFGEVVAKEGIAFSDVEKPLIKAVKGFWADQGDFLSRQYVGTGSTISKVSRDGKEGFLGKINHKMKNVQRYFLNTWSENPQQQSIDILLGRHAKSTVSSEISTYLMKEMEKRED